MHARTTVSTAAALAATALLAGCSPALDWRDAQLKGTALRMQFPCKPIQQQRQLALAGAPVTLSLSVCDAGGQTWGLVHADVTDPARVTAALQALRASAAANVGAVSVWAGQESATSASAIDSTAQLPGLQVPGATPNPFSQRASLQGRLPDGKPVQMQFVLFAHGTRVFQATVLGEQVSAAGADNFFASLAIRP